MQIESYFINWQEIIIPKLIENKWQACKKVETQPKTLASRDCNLVKGLAANGLMNGDILHFLNRSCREWGIAKVTEIWADFNVFKK